jgi:hypothetical protein
MALNCLCDYWTGPTTLYGYKLGLYRDKHHTILSQKDTAYYVTVEVVRYSPDMFVIDSWLLSQTKDIIT